MDKPALLEMRGICKEFPGVKALDNVDLTVRPGTVHALMGENGAGKSTLMKCLFGIYHRDAGTIKLDGKEVDFRSSKDALENGVAMVHQELNQALTRSVQDNLWLGRYPKVGGIMVSESNMARETKKIFDTLEVTVNPKAIMSTLPVSQRQMVEIAKAVSYNSKIIVFDEPTSSLTETEVEHLFRIINMLRDKGCGIIYISHKMEEILRISDDVTIMRDGQWVATRPAKELTMDEIIRLMVGRELTNRFPEKTNKPGDVILDVQHIAGKYTRLKDATFQLRKGEILGIAGLDGSGRTEVLENLFGAMTREGGTITLHGKPIRNPQRGHQKRLRAAHRGAAGHRHLRHPGHQGKHRDFQPEGLPDGRLLLKRQKDEGQHRLGHPGDAHQDPQPAHADPLAVRRQPAEGYSGPLAADQARDPSAGRAHPRHRRGRQIRNLSADHRPGQRGQGRDHGIVGNARASGRVRPDSGDVRRAGSR